MNSRGKEIDPFAVALHGAFDEIHFERADLQPRQPRVAAAAQQRFDPRRQFADVKGLDEIVVAARLQAMDALVDRGERADDKRGRGVAFVAQVSMI